MAKLLEVHCFGVEPKEVDVEAGDVRRLLDKGTHFVSWEEAWGWLERDVTAQQSIVAREIQRLRSALARAEKEAADTVVRAHEIRERRERWEPEANERRVAVGGKGKAEPT